MENFTNQSIDLDNLPKWEEVSFRPISKRYKSIIYYNTGIVWLIAMALLLALAFLNREEEVMLDWVKYLGIAGGFTVFLIIYLTLNLISFKRRGYAIREHDVLYRAGILSHYTLVIPIKHIQHVKIKESFLARMLNLVSVELYTAGTGQDMNILGLDKEEAAIFQRHISNQVSLLVEEAPSE